MVHHSGTTLPPPQKDLDSSVMGDSDTTEGGEPFPPFPQAAPPESLSFGSLYPRVETLVWAYGAGTGASPSLGSASTEDEDEDEAFRPPQLFDFDDLLEFDDLDGTHALMVRAPGAGSEGLRGRAVESSWVTSEKSFPSLGFSFLIYSKNCFYKAWMRQQSGEGHSGAQTRLAWDQNSARL